MQNAAGIPAISTWSTLGRKYLLDTRVSHKQPIPQRCLPTITG